MCWDVDQLVCQSLFQSPTAIGHNAKGSPLTIVTRTAHLRMGRFPPIAAIVKRDTSVKGLDVSEATSAYVSLSFPPFCLPTILRLLMLEDLDSVS